MLKPSPNILRLGIPKGSLENATVDLFAKAGWRISINERSYFPSIDDSTIETVLFRAQEMSRYVEENVVDVGLTGSDWIKENNSNVHEVAELVYSKATSRPARWVLAVPAESSVQRPEELRNGVIATELVQVTRQYFQERNIPVRVEFSWGATEVKARLLDAIVDITETGSSIRANNLRIIDTLLTSTTRLIANHQAWQEPWKREKIENIALLLQGAINAREKIGLKLNAPKDTLEAILKILPAEKSPTISALADGTWVAVEVIVEEKQERELIPLLKRAGATGLISYPLNKVIP
ncbi:MAG: ATP phosphoribosyltransferase [Planctomycetes bacterium]|nr:ATP phosphoribosyltransferase [Planctomycetota bacterium]MDA8379163.1 ATP phosphoribosyltransferase [Planctomycetia bacterium]